MRIAPGLQHSKPWQPNSRLTGAIRRPRQSHRRPTEIVAIVTMAMNRIRIVTPPSEGRQTLGVPIGPDQWVVQWLERNGEKIDAVMDAIDLLGKHDHDLARQTAARHDNRVMESLGKLMGPHNLLSYGTELSEADIADGYDEAERAFSRAQAQLPMRNGGGGLISASGISPVAFLSGGIDSIRFLTLHPDFAPEFLADLSVHKLSTSTLAPVAELRDAWHSVRTIDVPYMVPNELMVAPVKAET